MSEIQTTWHPRGAWHDILEPGRLGRIDGGPGLVVTPIEHLGIATVIASHGAHSDIAGYFNTHYGITLPTEPQAAHSAECTALWAGPEQWLLLSRHRNLASSLTEELRNAAAVSDQSDARAVMRLSGPNVRRALSKGCPIDLDPRALGSTSHCFTPWFSAWAQRLRRLPASWPAPCSLCAPAWANRS